MLLDVNQDSVINMMNLLPFCLNFILYHPVHKYVSLDIESGLISCFSWASVGWQIHIYSSSMTDAICMERERKREGEWETVFH